MDNWWKQHFPQGRQTIVIQDNQGRPIKLAYGEKGSGTPLFLIHGLGMWSVTWRDNIDALAQHFRVICIDNKGYGFSEKPANFDPPGYKIEDLKQVITALCDQPAILVSQSLWGTIILGLAEAYPELVSALVVIGGTIFPDQLPTMGLKVMARLPISWFQLLERSRLIQPLAPIIRGLLYQERKQVYSRRRVSDQELQWQAYPYIHCPGAISRLVMDVQYSYAEIRACHRQTGPLYRLEQRLPQITCPTLVLWGEEDQWFSVEKGKRLAEQLPNAQFHAIAHCGHDASSDCPEEVNRTIVNFLRSYPSQLS